MSLFSHKLRQLIAGAAILSASSVTMAAGLLTPTNGQTPALAIKDHHVEVIVQDGLVVTTIEQRFANPNDKDLEAIYSFPLPEHASVSDFSVWIDGQPVVGEVVEKEQAKTIYEQEKAAGRETGLTEQNGYKTFDIKVFPVRAQQDTKIRFQYFQTAYVDTGVGRYVYPLEDGGVDSEQMAFWTHESAVKENFSFNLRLRSSYPVDALRVAKLKGFQVTPLSDQEWLVSYQSGATDNTEEGFTQAAENSTVPQNAPAQAAFKLDQDIVVYWRHQQGLPGSIDLITHRPDANKPGTFMLTVTPGDDLAKIEQGADWTFVLDVSGSMEGKYATLADAVAQSLTKMRPDDRFRIFAFNESAHAITRGYVQASAENVAKYSQEVAKYPVGGSTNLFKGMQSAISSLDADRSSAIILVTDGVANVGETAQKAFLKLVDSKDVRLFTFIMGNSANRPLLEAMTKRSGGFAMAVSNNDEIIGHVLQAASKMTHTAMHDVSFKFKGIKVSDMTPEPIGSLYRGEQLILMGHYHDEGTAKIEMNAKVSGQKISYSNEFEWPKQSNRHPELERLWAYHKIQQLDSLQQDFGENADTQQAITDLALQYDLVTPYTSMIVLRDEQYQQYGIKRNNRKRVANEQQAQQQRANSTITSNRVDSNSPTFKSSRPSLGGGGSAGILLLVALGMLRLSMRT